MSDCIRVRGFYQFFWVLLLFQADKLLEQRGLVGHNLNHDVHMDINLILILYLREEGGERKVAGNQA